MRPHVMPRGVSRALDKVTDADKARFEQHRGQRWRVRPTDPAEWRSNGAMSLFFHTDGCVGCPACGPFVLVLCSPTGGARMRVFHRASRWATWADIAPWAAQALAAEIDEVFCGALAAALRALQVHP